MLSIKTPGSPSNRKSIGAIPNLKSLFGGQKSPKNGSTEKRNKRGSIENLVSIVPQVLKPFANRQSISIAVSFFLAQ